jgi:hypothetical protein
MLSAKATLLNQFDSACWGTLVRNYRSCSEQTEQRIQSLSFKLDWISASMRGTTAGPEEFSLRRQQFEKEGTLTA